MKTIQILIISLTFLFLIPAKQLKNNKILAALNCGLKEGSTKADGDIKYISVQIS